MLCSAFSSSFSLQESLASVAEKVCAELNSCLSQHGFTPFSAERETVLKGQIQAVANADNTICKLLGTLGREPLPPGDASSVCVKPLVACPAWFFT